MLLQVDMLKGRVLDAIEEVQRHRDEVLTMADKVDQLDNATGVGKGLMATIRSSLANDQVEKDRKRAAVDLSGVCGVLERRIQRALALAAETRILRDDIDCLGPAQLSQSGWSETGTFNKVGGVVGVGEVYGS